MKKLIYPNLIKTSYSSLWIEDDKVYQETPLSEPTIYRPTHFIVHYNNKYTGSSINMYPIWPNKTCKEIMQEMKYYAGKNVTNISVCIGKFYADYTDDGFTKRGKKQALDFSTLPIMSKKGGKLKQIDVNFMALLTVSDLYQLDDKLMHEIISEKMNPSAKTHADSAFTKQQCRAIDSRTEEVYQSEYIY